MNKIAQYNLAISKNFEYTCYNMSQTNINNKPSVSTAYFSMEIGFDERIPNYAGGLGILAGDTIKAALDLKYNMVAVTLLYKKGYFKQNIDDNGVQTESEDTWDYENILHKLETKTTIAVNGEQVQIQIWQYTLVNEDHSVPVYFLDTDLPSNSILMRSLSSNLYPTENQLLQEAILGIGGVQVLFDLGYKLFDNYHLNETHASMVTLALLEKLQDSTTVKEHICFTTHTPLIGGHEKWTKNQLEILLENKYLKHIPTKLWETDQTLNMAKLCLEFSKYANGVALKHQQVSQQMYPEYKIKAVTNGIHSSTWTSSHLVKIFNKQIPEWKTWAFSLREAIKINDEDIVNAHKLAKADLLEEVKKYDDICKTEFDPNVFTIGFARRAAGYKRHNFIFTDLERLEKIAKKHGGIQFVFAGKAYPTDTEGKKVIQQIHEINKKTSGNIRLVFIPNYNMRIGKLITNGVDLWLNNPIPPLEASGTSGMKASLNGVPNFSILDGWWIEGCIEGVTGWAIGDLCEGDRCISDELENMYHKLDEIILPLYKNQLEWARIMKQSIAINGSYFNTHRMLMEYVTEAYIHRST
jgi:glycogen phosphorylase